MNKAKAQESRKEETKREKFVRVVESRTNKIIDKVRLLGNCSNSSTYEYSQADVDKVFTAIDNEVKKAKDRFVSTRDRKAVKFTLE